MEKLSKALRKITTMTSIVIMIMMRTTMMMVRSWFTKVYKGLQRFTKVICICTQFQYKLVWRKFGVCIAALHGGARRGGSMGILLWSVVGKTIRHGG